MYKGHTDNTLFNSLFSDNYPVNTRRHYRNYAKYNQRTTLCLCIRIKNTQYPFSLKQWSHYCKWVISSHMSTNTAVLPCPIWAVRTGIRFLTSVGVHVLTQVSLVTCYVVAVRAFVLTPRPLRLRCSKAELWCILPGRETTHLAKYVPHSNYVL